MFNVIFNLRYRQVVFKGVFSGAYLQLKMVALMIKQKPILGTTCCNNKYTIFCTKMKKPRIKAFHT